VESPRAKRYTSQDVLRLNGLRIGQVISPGFHDGCRPPARPGCSREDSECRFQELVHFSRVPRDVDSSCWYTCSEYRSAVAAQEPSPPQSDPICSRQRERRSGSTGRGDLSAETVTALIVFDPSRHLAAEGRYSPRLGVQPHSARDRPVLPRRRIRLRRGARLRWNPGRVRKLGCRRHRRSGAA
jgi:hypothetical protein